MANNGKKTYYDSALIKGNTENGKDWLRKYLHPPGDRGMSYNGYPDKSVIPAIHAEYRLAAEIQPETIVTNYGNWSPNTLIMLRAPGLLYPAFFGQNLSTEDFGWKELYRNTQLSTASVLANFGKQRQAYGSVTAQYDTTDFANAGMVYHAQFSPTVYSLTLVELTTMLKDKKVYSKGLHKHLANLTQGATVDGFVDPTVDPRAIGLNTQKFQVVKLGASLVNPTDITMMSPKSYTARATEGLFSVNQCNEDTNQWKSVAPFIFQNGVTPLGATQLIRCLYEVTSSVDGRTYLEGFTDIANAIVTDVEWSDWTWSYTAFVGLTPSGGTVNAGSINFKEIQGYEVAPVSRSILNSQTSNPALYDPTAIESAVIITQSRQDGMPSEYNIAGLSSVISSIAPSMAKNVANAISGADSTKSEKKEIEQEIKTGGEVKKDIEDAERTNTSEETKMTQQRKAPVKQNRRPKRKSNNGNNNMMRMFSTMMRQMQNMRVSRPARSRSNSRRRSTSRGRSPSMNRGKPRTLVFTNTKYKK